MLGLDVPVHLHEELINEGTYKNSRNNCEVMEQKPKLWNEMKQAQQMMGLMEFLDQSKMKP